MSSNDSIPPGPVDAAPGQLPARILVVDDDLSVAQVIAHMAESLGHATAVAGSVDEALGRLAQASFDVVLTDLSMPGRSGLDLLKHVQAESPEIPVVLITGKGAIDTAMEAIKGGAYDYLAKPPQLEMLGALLRRAIEKKRMAEVVKHLQREVTKRAPAKRKELQQRFPNDPERVNREVEAWWASQRFPRTPLATLIDHIEHAIRVGGVDHVGLGSDYDGVPPGMVPEGLDDVSGYPKITLELLRRGHSPEDVTKVLGGNLLRVLREAERLASAAPPK